MPSSALKKRVLGTPKEGPIAGHRPTLQVGHLVNRQPLFAAPVAVQDTPHHGLKNDDDPRYQAVNKKYGDLPLSIEVDTHELIDASLEDLMLIFQRAVLKALVHAGRKLGRPTELLEQMLNSIPESVS